MVLQNISKWFLKLEWLLDLITIQQLPYQWENSLEYTARYLIHLAFLKNKAWNLSDLLSDRVKNENPVFCDG